MSLNARKVKNINSGPKAPLLDEGAYPARLVQVIDLGVQPQEYLGETKAPKNEIWTTYELVDEFMPDEDGEDDVTRPRWISESFPLNHLDSDRAKSTKRYYALDPKEEHEGEWSELLTKPVLVTIIQRETKTGEYNNVGGTSAMREKEASKLPDLVNEPKLFLMSNPDIEVFLSLPQFLQDKIKGGLEYEGSKLEELLANHKGTVGNDEKKEEVKKTQKKKPTAPDVSDGAEETVSHGDDDDDW